MYHPRMLRVVFAEDNYLVREGTVALLSSVDDVEVVGTAHGVAAKAENAAEGLQQLVKRKEGELRGAEAAVGRAAAEVTKLEQGLDETRATIEVLEKHEAPDGIDFLTPADVVKRLAPGPSSDPELERRLKIEAED